MRAAHAVECVLDALQAATFGRFVLFAQRTQALGQLGARASENLGLQFDVFHCCVHSWSSVTDGPAGAAVRLSKPYVRSFVSAER